jgi:hypothetical protein
VGESLTLEPELSLASVRAPSGAELPLVKQNDGTVVVGPVLEPGPHLARGGDGAVVAGLSFAATLDASESDLSRHPADALTQWFGEDTVRDAGGGSGAQPKVPLWTWLIALAVVAFFFEGVLLRK